MMHLLAIVGKNFQRCHGIGMIKWNSADGNGSKQLILGVVVCSVETTIRLNNLMQ